jgi:hypothetical protein
VSERAPWRSGVASLRSGQVAWLVGPKEHHEWHLISVLGMLWQMIRRFIGWSVRAGFGLTTIYLCNPIEHSVVRTNDPLGHAVPRIIQFLHNLVFKLGIQMHMMLMVMMILDKSWPVMIGDKIEPSYLCPNIDASLLPHFPPTMVVLSPRSYTVTYMLWVPLLCVYCLCVRSRLVLSFTPSWIVSF